MIALLLKNWTLVAIAGLTVLLGLQSWRLDNCQGRLDLTEQRLDTVRGDRDQAVRTAESNAHQIGSVNALLQSCVASKAADVAAAQESARAAIANREAVARELQAELDTLRAIYENDTDAGVWAATPVPPVVLDRLRRDDP